MTLDEYCNITRVQPTRLIQVYECGDYDEVRDRIEANKEYSFDEIDEYCLFSLSTTQTYTLKYFVKEKYANAFVMEQIIRNDRIYVFVEYDND